jgi:hypothetical protein
MLRTAKWSAALCLLIVLCGSAAHAQTVINAASCNESDVRTALGNVGSGSVTVTIPSGTCTWSSQLNYTVPSGITSLTIQGQTAVNCSGTAGTSNYACTATDNTVLVDNYSVEGAPILKITTGAPSSYFRMTGITFEGGSLSSGILKYNGFIGFSGSSQNFRVDHCNFNTNTYTPSGGTGGGFTIYSPLNGVVDHSTFEMIGESNGVRDYSGSADYGDTSWSQPTALGTSNFIFLENDIFTYGAANDCDEGARMVIRYNTIISNPNQGDTGLWQGHQMGQGTTRNRSCRVLDVNHNYIYNPNPSGNNEYTAANLIAFTGLDWANTITTGYSYDIVFLDDRELAALNAGVTIPAPPNGPGYCSNASSGSTSAWDGNSVAATGYPCMDQTGRGQGNLANGQAYPNMLNTVTGTVSWLQQYLEPWYVWNETIASGKVYNTPSYNGVAMVANRDFYSQVSASPNSSPTSPFNGTSGTGFGALANRPTTCTAGLGGTYNTSPTGSYGVGYFATDTNTLYVCTATNTWTAIYSPYTYPHPLVIGGTTGTSGNDPNPPTSLVATVE